METKLFKWRLRLSSGDSADTRFDPYVYSLAQKRMLHYHETVREALRFKKYYSFRATWCRFWNITYDFLIAAAACSALTSNTVFKNSTWGPSAVTYLLLFSALATIVKPLLKLNRKASDCMKLQRHYLIVYQKLARLTKEIELNGLISPSDEGAFRKLRDRFDKLGEMNEQSESDWLMKRMMKRIERAIPCETLWLPPSE